MKKYLKFNFVALLLLLNLYCLESQADNSSFGQIDSVFYNASADIKVSTLGVGGDISKAIIPNYLQLRFNGNYAAFNPVINGNSYSFSLQTYGLLLDYEPWGNSFRISAGMYVPRGVLNISSTQSTISLNSHLYNSNFSNLSSSITMDSKMPYFGIGFGSANNRNTENSMYFVFDLGVLLMSPTFNLSGSCTDTSSMNCAQFNYDLKMERQNIQNYLNQYGKYYPVVSIGFGYNF